MPANEAIESSEKKQYVKPQLVLHGSVQKLTEKQSITPPNSDCGSNVRFPTPAKGSGPFAW